MHLVDFSITFSFLSLSLSRIVVESLKFHQRNPNVYVKNILQINRNGRMGVHCTLYNFVAKCENISQQYGIVMILSQYRNRESSKDCKMKNFRLKMMQKTQIEKTIVLEQKNIANEKIKQRRMAKGKPILFQQREEKNK